MSLNARGYPTSGCQCPICDSSRRLRRRQRKLVQSGRGSRVPVAPVQEHVDALIADGWSMTRIALAARVPRPTVSEVRGRRFERIDRRTAEALLSVRGEAQNIRIPTLGTIRRLQALSVLGWPMREVCLRAGLAHRFGADTMRDHKTAIWAPSAEAIAAVYDELSMTPAPNSGINNQVRAVARRHGWAPPLAWDDIDDPAEQAVWQKPVVAGRAERFAALLDDGADLHEVLRSLEMNENALEKWCDRNDRRDAFNTLARAAWEREGRYCGNCERSIRSTKDHWCGMTREGVRRGAA